MSTPATICPPAASLPDLMARRLDAYLPTLQSDHARRVFLKAQLASFERQYGTFIQSGGKSARRDPVFGFPTEFDFSLTINAINTRLSALSVQEPA